MPKLAINGGTPVRTKLFPAYNTIGDEEKAAVLRVMQSGNLSQFLARGTRTFSEVPRSARSKSAGPRRFRPAMPSVSTPPPPA